jgi:hypothetical protein
MTYGSNLAKAFRKYFISISVGYSQKWRPQGGLEILLAAG